MRKHPAFLLSAGALVAVVGAGLIAAAAPATATPTANAASNLTGYTKVLSPTYSVAGSGMASGSVTCPGTTVPLGGGVTIATGDLHDNINSSYPSGQKWVVRVNIGGPDNTTFQVNAICANRPAGYQIVSRTAAVLAHSKPIISAPCPASTFAGGGGVSGPANLYVNLTDSYPFSNGGGWNGGMSYDTSYTTSFTTYVICYGGAHVSVGSDIRQSAYSEDPSRSSPTVATCPAGYSVVSGGAQAAGRTGSSLYQTVNSSKPYGNGWVSFVNNNEAVITGATLWVECTR
jgi:hypothetical protein